MAPPRKYATDDERRAAHNARRRTERAAHRAANPLPEREVYPKYIPLSCHDEAPVRPPAGVLMEWEHRTSLPADPGCPPQSYAGQYYPKAMRMQRMFEQGADHGQA